MAGNIKGITIEFRGDTTQLDKALRQVDKETSQIDNELKKVNTALKFNPTSVELWKQKQTLLTQKIKETGDKLKVLKDAQKQMDTKGVDKNSAEYRNLQREIIETESKLKTFKSQLKSIGSAKLSALGAQFKAIGQKMTSIGKTLTTKITLPLVAAGTVAANYASDYEENLNKLDVAFGKNAKTVKNWAETARKKFGLSKVQATGAASAFGALGKGIGLSDKQAAEMSTTLAGLSADLGSYFNTSTDESAKALEGIFTGESEALKKFGVVMTDTNLQAFAEDLGLVWKEMDQNEKTTLRYQYVLSKTKDAQGDFSRTSDGTANSIKIFKASLQDLATAIGENLLPIVTPVIQKVSEFVNKLNELPPQAQKIITIIGLVAAAAGPLLVVIGSIVTAVGTILPLLGGISAPVLGIAAGIGAVVAAMVALYTQSASFREAVNGMLQTLASAFLPVIKSLGVQFKTLINEIATLATEVSQQLGPVFKALAPIFKFVVKLIAGLVLRHFNLIIGTVRVIIAVVKTLALIFGTIFKTIGKIITGAYKTIKGWFQKIHDSIINPIKNAKERIANIISKIKEFFNLSNLVEKVKSTFDRIKEKITGPIESAKEKVKGIIDKIKGIFPIDIGKLMSNVKLPHFSLEWGSKDFGPLGTVSYPKGFNISWYAKGGIFNSPTLAGIGESGPEAVVPLDKFWEKLEQMQNGGMVVNVYGSDNMSVNELAEAVEQKIIQMEKRRRLAWQ